MTPLQTVLESALVANPDDLAAHMALGDFLAEQGDSRGEFIQVQLALEDAQRSADERRRLTAREGELLAQHRAGWLGALAEHFPAESEGLHVGFRRGWVDTLRIPLMTPELDALVPHAPQLRLLRHLSVLASTDYSLEALGPLAAGTVLGNVRVLAIGDCEGHAGFETYNSGWMIDTLVRTMPRLEELHLNAHEVTETVLNLTAPRLHTLRLDRVPLGHDGLGRLLVAPFAQQLKSLQLWNAHLTDDSVQTLCRLRVLQNLELLDLSFNWFTPAGVEQLAGACRRLIADYQTSQVDDVNGADVEWTME